MISHLSKLADELKPMPEAGDYYIRADILLPRGDEMARGHVVVQSHDANGNIMGRAHANPISILECIKLSLLGARL